MCKKINVFFPIFIIGYVILSLLYGFITELIGVEIPYWLNCIISEGLILLTPIIYILVNHINVMKALPIRKLRPVDGLLSLLFGYLLIPTVLMVNGITMMFARNHLEEVTPVLTQYPYLVQIILMAVLPPLVEEFIFRGLFYHSYRRNGVVGAALVSGLIFGAAHMNINQFCYAFLIGVVFALLVEATGSIWASVITHFAINTFSITVTKIITMTNANAITENAQNTESFRSLMAAEGAAYGASMVIAILFLLFIVACSIALAFCVYRKIAIRNGRWEYMKHNFRLGLKAQNGEKFFTPLTIATFVAVAAFMIYLEL